MKKKILAACLVVCLLATAVIGTTLAYFTDTKEVKNTFTTGEVEIVLSESKWDQKDAKLIPGKKIEKNPTITVLQNSEPAYVFAKVQWSKDFYDVLNAYAEKTDKALPVVIEEWFGGFDLSKNIKADLKDGMSFVLSYGVHSPDDDTAIVFDGVNVPAELTQEMVKNPKGVYTVDITAYAVQAEGFDNAEAAWNATFGK